MGCSFPRRRRSDNVSDAAATGTKVLAALEAGRARAIDQAKAQAAQNQRAVREALDVDIIAGNPERGRAGRIARVVRVHGYQVTRRTVQRILDKLSSVSSSACSDASAATGEPSAAK